MKLIACVTVEWKIRPYIKISFSITMKFLSSFKIREEMFVVPIIISHFVSPPLVVKRMAS